MENKQLIEKYRHQLMAVHAATVAIVSFVEIIAYFVFVGYYEGYIQQE